MSTHWVYRPQEDPMQHLFLETDPVGEVNVRGCPDVLDVEDRGGGRRPVLLESSTCVS